MHTGPNPTKFGHHFCNSILYITIRLPLKLYRTESGWPIDEVMYFDFRNCKTAGRMKRFIKYYKFKQELLSPV